MKSVAARINPTFMRRVSNESNELVGLGRPVKSVRQNFGPRGSKTIVSSTSTSSSICVGLSALRRFRECAAVVESVGTWSSTSTSVTVISTSSARILYWACVRKLAMNDGTELH